SPNVEKLTGVTSEEVKADVGALARTGKEYNSSETESIVREMRALKPGEQSERDMEFIHKKTKEPIWFRIVVLCSEIMGRNKYIVVMSDRTRDKAVNNALAEAVAAAQSANRAKSAFLSNMSHDIRTPMNAIIGFATLAAADPANAEKVKDYLSKILSSGNHLLTLINDILDMSRIESGKICLDETEVNLSDVFHEIKSIIEGQVGAKRLNLVMDVMDVADENVYCDKLRLKQALLNLLSNAVKFTPSGGTVTVSIVQRLGAPEGTGNYEITVKDTGIGMSPQFVRKIFEPFERERTAEVNQTQGTGLGMSITKSIIDMMGGTIEVHSEKGRGTEFIVRLTLKLGAGRSEKIAQLEGVKALVASDDFSTCDSVMKMLMRMGMRSEWTLSGKEAILRAKQSKEIGDAFRVYIIDGQLPDMSGVATAKKIRAIDDGMPVIIMTAYDRLEIEDEALSAGVNALCSKPMFTSDLYDSLLCALGLGKEKAATLTQLNAENCNFEGKRALLVDDNALNREIAVEILQSYGLTVETAENGKQAVEMQAQAAAGYYDVILTDVQMPVMDGCAATKAIRALDDKAKASVPIIAMTANAFDEDKQEAFESGMNDFVSKPIDVAELINVLKRHVGE
ncbi:MAG: response regulator, partial [Candidatus Neoclostridium sp.]